MTPSALLVALRRKGYTVRFLDGAVVATGPTPKDPVAAAQMLRDNEDELARLLRAEARQEVKDATEILGATLIEARDVPAEDGKVRK